MNYLMIVFSLLVLTIPLVYSEKSGNSRREFEDREISSGLCKPPVVISSIDSFANGSIRIYKDKNWWELKGLPDKVGFISNNGTTDLENMNEVKADDSISTVLEGPHKGITYKFSEKVTYSWSEDGKQLTGDEGGEFFPELPNKGFSAVFHNADNKDPNFIGWRDNKVYYISTATEYLTIENKKGYKGGKHKENYPPAIDAAFVRTTSDGKHDLYLFKGQQYCIRKIAVPETGNESCGEWRENVELFGCLSPTEPPTKPKESVTEATEVHTTASDKGEEPEPTYHPLTENTPKAEPGVKTNSSSHTYKGIAAITFSSLYFTVFIYLFV